MLALDFCDDPARGINYILVVLLRQRPQSTAKRAETAFWAFGAEVRTIDSFGPERAAEMRTQLKLANDVQKPEGRHKPLGSIFVMLFCVDSGVSNIAPAGLHSDVLESRHKLCGGRPWKQWMLTRLNEGIVS